MAKPKGMTLALLWKGSLLSPYKSSHHHQTTLEEGKLSKFPCILLLYKTGQIVNVKINAYFVRVSSALSLQAKSPAGVQAPSSAGAKCALPLGLLSCVPTTVSVRGDRNAARPGGS